ncbi:TlpA disulfide reductase family protein [Piscinibacter sp.]|jgi:cytochrome c biogenesis protein CcmG/thiol:disulfide interchange protein DsbE|uniref:TlpA disulfide reductase family protein n=1 Tax=Piscinibacter sp. TaxID=1903157 RepID=UPI003559D9B1
MARYRAKTQFLGPTRRGVLSWVAVSAIAIPLESRAGGSPSISATLLDGRAFSTDQIKGKVLLVNFWATWCGPCRQEMPELDAYYRQHRDQGLEVLALSTDELKDENQVREAAKPFSFPVAMLKTSRLSGFGRIWRMPVSAVIDRDGRLVKQDWFIQPKLDAAALDAVIKPLL